LRSSWKRLALDEKHRFLALDVDLVAHMGAYLSQFAPLIPTLGAVLSPGVYDISTCHVRVRGVYTNTAHLVHFATRAPLDLFREMAARSGFFDELCAAVSWEQTTTARGGDIVSAC
jgi:CO/xanthine dehydrogenase Mo-binding subunit